MDVLLSTNEQKKIEINEKITKIIDDYHDIKVINAKEHKKLLKLCDDNMNVIKLRQFIETINKICQKPLIDLLRIKMQLFDDAYSNTNNKLTYQKDNLLDKIIESSQNIVYTNDQKKAMKSMMDFLFDDEENVFLCSGYAGVGKTTIIVELMLILIRFGIINSVVFTAPTNKAVNVMKAKFKSYQSYLNNDDAIDKTKIKNTKIDFITIHKLLKFEMDFDMDGEIIFVKNASDSLINKYDVVLIDECSMISIKLIESIFIEISKAKTKKISKVIFSGDPAQLNPVNETESMLFSKDLTNCNLKDESLKLFVNMKEITLKDVVRSKIENVTKICYQFRLWAIDGSNEPDILKYINKKKGAFAYNDKKDWLNACMNYYKNGEKNNIILTWTNRQCDEYNYKVRQQLFKKTKLEKFEVGDILMLNDFYSSDEIMSLVEEPTKKDVIRLYTSEQIIVVGVETITKQFDDFVKKTNLQIFDTPSGKHYQSKYYGLIDKINSSKNEYLSWKLTVKKMENINEPTTFIIYILNDKFEKKFTYEKDYISNKIKALKNLG